MFDTKNPKRKHNTFIPPWTAVNLTTKENILGEQASFVLLLMEASYLD